MTRRFRKGKWITVKPMRILSGPKPRSKGDLRFVVTSRTSASKHVVTRRAGKWGCSCFGNKPRSPKGKPKAPKVRVECFHIKSMKERAA